MPPEWVAMLKASGIKEEELVKNADTIKKVLYRYTQKIPKMPIPLPEEEKITLGNAVLLMWNWSLIKDDVLNKQDPNKLYFGLRKIGEGGVAEVYEATDKKTKKKVFFCLDTLMRIGRS